MTGNFDHIRGLLLEKYNGTISDADDRLVEDAIRNDAGVRCMWLDIQQQLSKPKAIDFVNKLNADQSWANLQSRLKNTQQVIVFRRSFKKWLSVAAMSGLVLAWGVYLYNSQKGPLITSRKKNADKVELTLANGEKVDLSDTGKRVIRLASASINQTGKSLSVNSERAKQAEWGTLTVPSRLDYQVVLPDGSQVWINSSSSIRFPLAFSQGTREVYLQGEAFFKVAKDAAHPFIVHTSQTDIRVLGTRFNVNTYSPLLSVTSLVEGSVKTYTPDHKDSLFLKPGYQSVYHSKNGFARQSFDESIELGWMQGVYYFHNNRLRDLGDILMRWFNMEVVFDRPAIANHTLTGAIEKNKLDVFRESLKLSSGLESYVTGNQLHIK